MEYQHLTTACEVVGSNERPFSAPVRPTRKTCISPSDEQIVDGLIRLTGTTKLHRMIVTGPNCVETLLELHRRGYLRVTTAALCDVPCGQFDVALVAWRERSVEALGITLNGLAARDRIQSLRLALRELGVTLCMRRAEPIAAVA
jgi:hypothetical protein